MDSERRRDNLFFIGATIILTAIVIGLVLFVFYEKGIIFKKNDEEQKDIVEKDDDFEEKEEIVDEEITDVNVKNDLSEKIDFITNFNLGQTISPLYTFRSGADAALGNVFNDFTSDVKIHVVLTYLNAKGQFSPITDAHKSSSVISNFVNSGAVISEISGEIVNNKYREYFGGNIFNSGSQIGDSCFTYYYDSSINTYFWVTPACGGASSESVLAYKNKFVTHDNLAYVYVNYGVVSPINETTIDFVNIYKDLAKTTVYQSNVASGVANNFRIDASNYLDFSEYKFTFAKDSNNNYYFTKLEKLS